MHDNVELVAGITYIENGLPRLEKVIFGNSDALELYFLWMGVLLEVLLKEWKKILAVTICPVLLQ